MMTLEEIAFQSPVDHAIEYFTALPRAGTPAAELTDRDKIAIAMAAGVPCVTEIFGCKLTIRSKVPFAIADRGDGGYIVATRKT